MDYKEKITEMKKSTGLSDRELDQWLYRPIRELYNHYDKYNQFPPVDEITKALSGCIEQGERNSVIAAQKLAAYALAHPLYDGPLSGAKRDDGEPTPMGIHDHD